MAHQYTPEQVAFIKTNIFGHSRKEMTAIVNAHFGIDLSLVQITAFIKNRHLKTGLDGRFPKGHIPFNKGTSIGGYEPTQFPKGHKPWNYKPVGTERINTDGYVEIKIADPKTWKGKHVLIWEAANGPVPKGHAVIFADGDKLNVTLDNLLLVSRRELAIMNKRKLISNDAELTKTGIIIADIQLRIGERKKK